MSVIRFCLETIMDSFEDEGWSVDEVKGLT